MNFRVIKMGRKADEQPEHIIGSAVEALRNSHSKPETALQHARKAAEAICRDVYQKEYGKEPRELWFGQMIHALSKEKPIFPNLIMYSLRIIQNFGGINAHEYIPAVYLKAALVFFPAIVIWYFEDYKNGDIPDEIRKEIGFDGIKIEGEPKSDPERNGENTIAHIDDSVVAIVINQTYKDGLSGRDLYNHTRGTWKISKPRADKARYAFAVYRGAVQEVYEIHQWLPSDSPEMIALVGKPNGNDGRWGFNGSVAPDNIREKYIGRLLPDRFYGNPIRYYNC